jgi:hypothetical protein
LAVAIAMEPIEETISMGTNKPQARIAKRLLSRGKKRLNI